MRITNLMDITILESQEIELEILSAEMYTVDYPPGKNKILSGESLVDYIVDNNISLGNIRNRFYLI